MITRRSFFSTASAAFGFVLKNQASGQVPAPRSNTDIIELLRTEANALTARCAEIPDSRKPEGLIEALAALKELLKSAGGVVLTTVPEGNLQLTTDPPQLRVDRESLRGMSEPAVEAVLAEQVVSLLPTRKVEGLQLALLSARFKDMARVLPSIEKDSAVRAELVRFCGLWVRHHLQGIDLQLAVLALQARALKLPEAQHLRRVARELRDPQDALMVRGVAGLIDEGQSERGRYFFLRDFVFYNGLEERLRDGLLWCAKEAKGTNQGLSYSGFTLQILNEYAPWK